MAVQTRVSLEACEVPELMSHIVLVTLWCKDEQERETISLSMKSLVEHLGHGMEEIEGILKLPPYTGEEDQGKVGFALLFQEREVEEGEEGFMTAMSRVLTEFKVEVKIEDILYKCTSYMISELVPAMQNRVLKNLTSATTTGQPYDTDWEWFGNEAFAIHSTPIKPEGPPEGEGEPKVPTPVFPPLDPQGGMEQLFILIGQLQGELNALKTKPIAGALDASISAQELGKTIAEQNQGFIVELANKGVISSQVPKVASTFSGDNLKGDVAYETWEYEITNLFKNHTDVAVRKAIISSLKGSALDVLRSLGSLDDLIPKDIIAALRSKFGSCADVVILLGELYGMVQKESEDISKYTSRLEAKASDILIRFPETAGFSSRMDSEKVLKNVFYWGCKDIIRSQITFKYEDPETREKTTFKELTDIARRCEEGGNRRDTVLEKEKKKAQVKPEIVSNDSSLNKLANLAEQCKLENATNKATIKQLTQVFKDFEQRNNPLHVPYDQRGNQNQGNQGNGNGNGKTTGTGKGRGYQGNNFDPNYQANRGRGNGNRGGRGGGRGTGRGYPDQSQNLAFIGRNQGNQGNQNSGPQNQNQNQNRTQNQNNQGGNDQRRQPSCHWCVKAGLPQTDHWPKYCQVAESAIAELLNKKESTETVTPVNLNN